MAELIQWIGLGIIFVIGGLILGAITGCIGQPIANLVFGALHNPIHLSLIQAAIVGAVSEGLLGLIAFLVFVIYTFA